MTDTTTNPNWHLEKVYSDRGFARLPKIPSEYGGDVSVYESAAAMGPHVWLTAKAPKDLNNPDGATVEAPMHSTADNARRLGEQLIQTAMDHYQGNPLKFALELIGTKCENFTGDWACSQERSGRSPYARYGADRWCDHCIARVALECGEFPERGTSGVEEVEEP